MDRLRDREFAALHKFLVGAYATTDLTTFQTYLVTTLPRLIPADITTYAEMNPARGRDTMVSRPTVDEINTAVPNHLAVWQRHSLDHPVLVHYLKTGNSSALRISDFISQRGMKRRGLYAELFRRLGIEYTLCAGLPSPRPRHLVIGTSVHRRSRDFSDRERLLLNVARPHLMQAYLNAAAMTRVLEKLTVARMALEALPFGTVVLARNGTIRLTTGRAQALLAAYFGAPSGPDRLPEALGRWVRHSADVSSHSPVPSRLPLVVEHEQMRLVVRLNTMGDQVLLLLEERAVAIEGSRLEALGLSRRQAEVLAGVIQGKTNAEIGRLLEISTRTVDTQLQRVYDKLGVATRAAAVAYALEGLTKIWP